MPRCTHWTPVTGRRSMPRKTLLASCSMLERGRRFCDPKAGRSASRHIISSLFLRRKVVRFLSGHHTRFGQACSFSSTMPQLSRMSGHLESQRSRRTLRTPSSSHLLPPAMCARRLNEGQVSTVGISVGNVSSVGERVRCGGRPVACHRTGRSARPPASPPRRSGGRRWPGASQRRASRNYRW